ncbi:MAG: PRC-barrel domain containing protein [Desulfurivibrio sp.]|nr:MAG: PRC-barrel domain containing protein [Desulfurivibrio sp.]
MKKLTALLMAILAFVLVAGPAFAGEMAGEKSATPAVTRTYSQDELVNLAIFNREGKEIGRISDVNINPDTGAVNFVTLASGSVLPVEALEIHSAHRTATLLVPEDKLATAPVRATGMSNEEFRGIINKHYGIAPAWGKGVTEPPKMMEKEGKHPEKSNY